MKKKIKMPKENKDKTSSLEKTNEPCRTKSKYYAAKTLKSFRNYKLDAFIEGLLKG